jgi:hypothetical protein
MLRQRVDQLVDAGLRRSPRFERYLATRTAIVVTALLGIAALAGALVAVWRAEWIDAGIRFGFAAAFAAWTSRASTDRPPHAPEQLTVNDTRKTGVSDDHAR